jgi:hypothetical protein
VRGDEDVTGEERFEVYKGEGMGGCVEDLPFSQLLVLCCTQAGSRGSMVGFVLGRLR